MCTISEIWLASVDGDSLMQIPDYSFVTRDRPNSKPRNREGGVSIYVKSGIRFEQVNLRTEIEDFALSSEFLEIIVYKISVSHRIESIAILTAYKPPKFSCIQFLGFLESSISELWIKTPSIVCLGEFNLDISPTTTLNKNVFDSIADLQRFFDMKQIINEPTRELHLLVTII